MTVMLLPTLVLSVELTSFSFIVIKCPSFPMSQYVGIFFFLKFFKSVTNPSSVIQKTEEYGEDFQ